MEETIQIKLSPQACSLGSRYAQKHWTTPPKDAVISCEGMCLRGEISRRAANLIAQKMAPEKAVRICHGSLLEKSGGMGMKELVERAKRVLVLDGCGMRCSTRLTEGALASINPVVVITDALFDFDQNLFSVDEMSEVEIQSKAQVVADKIVDKYFKY